MQMLMEENRKEANRKNFRQKNYFRKNALIFGLKNFTAKSIRNIDFAAKKLLIFQDYKQNVENEC